MYRSMDKIKENQAISKITYQTVKKENLIQLLEKKEKYST
jgi:hypothetical protein